MSVSGRVLRLGLLGAVGVVLSCGKGGGAGGPSGTGEEGITTPPEVFAKNTFNPQLVVVDATGAPIASATVLIGMSSVKAKADGTATLPEQATDAATVVTVSADGYAPATKTLSLANAYTPLSVSLSKLVSVTVEAETGGSVQAGSTQVRLPGQSFLRPDGTPYTGPVRVLLVNLFDALNPADTTSGDGLAAGASGPEPLDLMAGLHVELRADDNALLTFSAGERAVVSFVLPDDSGHQVGETLALFTLDDTTGLWQESASCQVQRAPGAGDSGPLTCVGEVEHFSSVAFGRRQPAGRFCRKFTLKLAKGFPRGATLRSWWVDVPGRSFRCQVGRPGADAPLGTCTVTAAVRGRPDKLWVRPSIGTGWFARGHQRFYVEVPGSYDGTCPETVLQYNPLTRRMALGAPPADNATPVDKDGDGYFAKVGDSLLPGDDCDDADKNVHPGAHPVVCTGKDHDCDGKPDISRVGAELDGLPDLAWNLFCVQTRMTCAAALKTEVAGNGRDEDCDGFVSDGDGDGFFARGDPGFADSGKPADCNDRNAEAHPGATETPGNVIDENCDGVAADQDGDGYPSPKQLALSGTSQTTGGVDCNDLDDEAHPGAAVKDLPVLAEFYQGGKRSADFCSLFDKEGRPTAKLQYLLFKADRNCNGVLEDLDGDGQLVAAAGVFANPPPYDGNDLDPRVQGKGQPGEPNESSCSPNLDNFGGGSRQVCPRLFNREQLCVETYLGTMPTGEFACGAPEWNVFSVPPDPFAFSKQYGPCSTMVLPDCGGQSLCGGPITFAPWYVEALKKNMTPYDVSAESFTGFCMPTCTVVP